MHANADASAVSGAASSIFPTQQTNDSSQKLGENGELPLDFLKKFIAYARATCAPRLSEKASEKLINNYVKFRNPPRSIEQLKSKSIFFLNIKHNIEGKIQVIKGLFIKTVL